MAVAGILICPSYIATAQDDDYLFDEDQADVPDAPTSQPTRSIPKREEPRFEAPTSSFSAPVTAETEGQVVKGFEFGINFGGKNSIFAYSADEYYVTLGSGVDPKVAFQPGWNFGRFGIYLFFGFDYKKESEKAEGQYAMLGDATHPEAGAASTSSTFWREELTIDTSIFTYDIGLGARFYLLEALMEESANLYVGLDLGWRGAATQIDIKWQGASHSSLEGELDARYDSTALAQKVTDDWAEAAKQQYDGFWMNIGIGGEYVFVGGFGIAGEVGFSLFYNNQWKNKAPYVYDDDDRVGRGQQYFTYENAKWTGDAVEFGMYYSLALRYHF
jgi:hypothetical protein